MGEERLDCTWCGSARSIEHGMCQVCLMEYALDTQVIQLPVERDVPRRIMPLSTRALEPQSEVAAE